MLSILSVTCPLDSKFDGLFRFKKVEKTVFSNFVELR